MPVINTKTNHVVAYEADEDCPFVQVVWHGPHEDGQHLTNFEGPPWPVAEYQACVDWAVSMADQMRFPLRVVPMRARDVFKPREVLAAFPHLSDQERGKLRAFVVRAMVETMRDCADQELRGDAYRVLVNLGVVKP